MAEPRFNKPDGATARACATCISDDAYLEALCRETDTPEPLMDAIRRVVCAVSNDAEQYTLPLPGMGAMGAQLAGCKMSPTHRQMYIPLTLAEVGDTYYWATRYNWPSRNPVRARVRDINDANEIADALLRWCIAMVHPRQNCEPAWVVEQAVKWRGWLAEEERQRLIEAESMRKTKRVRTKWRQQHELEQAEALSACVAKAQGTRLAIRRLAECDHPGLSAAAIVELL